MEKKLNENSSISPNPFKGALTPFQDQNSSKCWTSLSWQCNSLARMTHSPGSCISEDFSGESVSLTGSLPAGCQSLYEASLVPLRPTPQQDSFPVFNEEWISALLWKCPEQAPKLWDTCLDSAFCRLFRVPGSPWIWCNLNFSTSLALWSSLLLVPLLVSVCCQSVHFRLSHGNLSSWFQYYSSLLPHQTQQVPALAPSPLSVAEIQTPTLCNTQASRTALFQKQYPQRALNAREERTAMKICTWWSVPTSQTEEKLLFSMSTEWQPFLIDQWRIEN